MKTLELPDSLYRTMEEAANVGGFENVTAYLEHCHRAVVREHNRAISRRIDARREEIRARTGVQPDCVEQLREDRAR